MTAAAPTTFERVLARTGDDPAGVRLAKIRAFHVIFAIGLAAEAWRDVAPQLVQGEWGMLILRPALMTVLALASLSRASARSAFLGLMLVEISWLIETFPLTANHLYLQIILLGLLAFCDFEKEEEQILWLRSVRWLFLVVFFYAGVQKLVHGYYFQAEYFAYYLDRPSFGAVLQYFISAEEYTRFTTQFDYAAGDGPYRFQSLVMIGLSNAAYLTEMVAPFLLMIRRTRVFAIVVTLGFLVFTETMARELYFGALYLNGLLLFVTPALNQKLVPLFAGFYFWLFLMSFDVVPGMTFW